MTAVDLDALDKLRGALALRAVMRRNDPLRLTANEVAVLDQVAAALPDLIAEARRYRALRAAVEVVADIQSDESVDAIWHRDCLRNSAARLRAVVATVDGEQ